MLSPVLIFAYERLDIDSRIVKSFQNYYYNTNSDNFLTRIKAYIKRSLGI